MAFLLLLYSFWTNYTVHFQLWTIFFLSIILQALVISMDQYLQGLFLLANDPVPDVRKLVCKLMISF